MKKTIVVAMAVALAMATVVPAFATGAGGAGLEYGQHHAAHAQEAGGFTGADNPGVMHKGFSGWTGE